MAKSAAFGAVQLSIAFSVGYALTASLAIAGAMTLVEPLCNTVAHYFFDRWWDRRTPRAADGSVACSSDPSQSMASAAV